MEINEFAQKVLKAVEKELGGEYRAELKEVRKNNGVKLHGLLILQPGKMWCRPSIWTTFMRLMRTG